MLWFLTKLAAKNLMRQKRRTILTFLTLSLGIATYILFDSMLVGLDQTSINNLIGLESGHVQVFPEPYREERDELTLDYTYLSAPVEKRIKEIPEITAFTPRLSFSAQLNNGVDELPIMAVGIDPKTVLDVFNLAEYLEGEMPQAGHYEAVLGKRLADLMELTVGDYFTLITKTKSGAYQAIDLVITGLLNTPHPEINSSIAYLPIDIASNALGIPNEVTSIVIKADSFANVSKIVASLNKVLPSDENLAAYSWETIAEDFLTVSKSERKFQSIFLLMIFLIGAIGVVNTILLSSLERVKEIGMMKAMGMKESQITTEFVLEALGIGLLGGMIGLVCGTVCVYYLVNTGIDYSLFFDQDMDIGYPVIGAVRGAWNISAMVLSVVFGIGVCLIASFLPARAAAAKDPIQSLRQD